MIMAAMFGASAQTDIILLAQTLVGDFQYLLTQVMLTATTSIYIHLNADNKQDSRLFARNLCRITLLLSLGLTVLLLLAAPVLSIVIAPAYSEGELQRLTMYLRLHIPALSFICIGVVFQALLHANKRFLPGQLYVVLQNTIWILAMLLLGKMVGVNALVIAFLAYAVLSTIMLAVQTSPYWRGKGYPFQIRTKYFGDLLNMMGPLLLSYSMVFINQQVDKIVSSSLEEGVITSLVYGSSIYSLVSTFIVSGASIFFSYVTDDIAHGRQEQVGHQITEISCLFIAAVLPLVLILIICSQEIISILFGHGAFDETAVLYAGQALRGYAVALVPLCIRELFTRLQYGYRDSKGPMISSTISILCNIPLTILLGRSIGVLGITLATSLSIAVCSILNMHTARKLNRFIHLGDFLKPIPYFLIGSALCIGILWISRSWLLGIPQLLRFVVRASAALLGYCIAIAPIIIRFFLQKKVSFPRFWKKK